MRKLIIAFVSITFFVVDANAQKKKESSGAIQFETSIDPSAMMAASGITISPEMSARIPSKSNLQYELLFTPTQASYMAVEETEDSNGGGGGGGFGRMMMRFGGGGLGGNKQYFYSIADKKMVEVFDLNDTTYYMDSKLRYAPTVAPVRGFSVTNTAAGTKISTDSVKAKAPEPPKVEIVKTDSTKEIIGMMCKQVIIKTTKKMNILGTERDIVDETQLWYTNDLGFDFSPVPTMWTEGAVLAIINRGSSTIAKSVNYRRVANSDVTAPKKAISITQTEYDVKQKAFMETMRTRFGQGRRNN